MPQNHKKQKPSWEEANRDYLMASLAIVEHYLEADTSNPEQNEDRLLILKKKLEEVYKRLPAPSSLDRLCAMFDLNTFERYILLLCAGVELDSQFASACSSSQSESTQQAPTFSLALSKLPEAVWESLSPAAPLRQWRMLEIGGGSTLTMSPLRLDERILHYLTGVQYFDERLMGMMSPVYQVNELVPSQEEVALRISKVYTGSKTPLVIQLCGDDVMEKKSIAASAGLLLGLNLWSVDMSLLPDSTKDCSEVQILCEREALLGGAGLLFDFDEVEDKPATHARHTRFIEQTSGFRVLLSQQRKSMPHIQMLTLEVKKPTHDEQKATWGNIWQSLTGEFDHKADKYINRLAYQFDIGASSLPTVFADASGKLQSNESSQKKPAKDKSHTDEEVMKVLWDNCRVQARPRLDNLVQRIEPSADWDDLILPEQQIQILRDIAAQMENRSTVYGDWGFSSKGERGLGIAALFAGNSGTGKTFAAEVLANHLSLDLYRIDLSSVINKYIGETEKNLGRVFATAEAGGAILLFDEADALFGKRSAVKDSHDRHANIEVSYLLQRMESYRGLAILTTNLKENLDTAFLRRLRFIAQFPFPDAEERSRIWETVFPLDLPMDGVDLDKLGQLNVSGGTIRNIALNAAFYAAESDGVLTMSHVLKAARSEYFKMEKTLTESEIRGWV